MSDAILTTDERICKGGGECPEPMWCGLEDKCLWDKWNPKVLTANGSAFQAKKVCDTRIIIRVGGCT